jgi:N-acetylmuramoyl-L-alanine amidase
MVKKVFIDPGHGGKDPGASGNGLQEKNVTLQISLKTRDILLNEYEGADVKLSRTGDTHPSLNDRSNAANAWGADICVSIHINSGAASAKGFESFRWNKTTDAATTALHNTLHAAVLKREGLDDRGKKTADLHMCRETNMPAILTESGFISNASDSAKMKQASWIEQAARGHAEGIASFLGLKKKAAGATAPTTGTAKAKLYRVQVGAFEDKDNADQLLKDLQ